MMKGDRPEDKKRKDRIDRLNEAMQTDPDLHGAAGEAVKYILFGPSEALAQDFEVVRKSLENGRPDILDQVLQRYRQPGDLLDEAAMSPPEVQRLRQIEAQNTARMRAPRSAQPMPQLPPEFGQVRTPQSARQPSTPSKEEKSARMQEAEDKMDKLFPKRPKK